jgi:hypothetical protein
MGINESGVIVQDVAVGTEPILALVEKAKELVGQQGSVPQAG